MVILIDDERTSTPDGVKPDIILRNYSAAMYWLIMENEVLSQYSIYLDHDLGERLTGYDWISQLELEYEVHGALLPAKIVCVSDNPQGRARIQQVIDKLYGGDDDDEQSKELAQTL